MRKQQGVARIAPVVVGAAALAAGVLMNAAPASAQLHHLGKGDLGAGLAAGAIGGFAQGAVTMAANPGIAAPIYDEAYAGDCTRKSQKFWDGYGWRSQRVQVCE